MLKVLKDPPPSSPWYEKGLHFKCTECGKCCTGSPGYVWITEQEVINMAGFLKLSIDEFTRIYVRQIGDRLSLNENPKTYDCVFLKDKKCQIYPVRPIQCQTFPWWPQNLKTEQDWQDASHYCEGISIHAPLVAIDVISTQLSIQEGNQT